MAGQTGTNSSSPPDPSLAAVARAADEARRAPTTLGYARPGTVDTGRHGFSPFEGPGGWACGVVAALVEQLVVYGYYGAVLDGGRRGGICLIAVVAFWGGAAGFFFPPPPGPGPPGP